MGRVRPLFEDGLFRHKRAWGAVLGPDPWEEALIHVYPGKTQEIFRALPARHPFIEEIRGRLRARVAMDGPFPQSEEALKKILHTYETPGVGEILLTDHDGAERSFRG